MMGSSDFQNQLQSAGGKLVVVDFSATWCGPCKFIKPLYHQMSTEYTDVVFLAVDEGQNQDVIMSIGTYYKNVHMSCVCLIWYA